jgi:hypothetical protein
MHCHKIEAWADIRQIRTVAAVAAEGWDPVTLRMEQLNDPEIGHILEVVETGRHRNGKTSLIAAPHTKATGLSGNRSL